jgi:L-type amino acid transporter 9
MALQVGNIIGTGIYSAPTNIIDSTGSVGLALAIWIIVGLISMCGGLVYAEVTILFC